MGSLFLLSLQQRCFSAAGGAVVRRAAGFNQEIFIAR